MTLERRDVSANLGRYLRDPSALKGTQARMRIGFGRMLDPRYVQTIPAVNRGDIVEIRVEVGAIRVSAQGVATEVEPRAGTLVAFLSEKIPHEVLAATRERYSIAGWFRCNNTTADWLDPPR